MLNFKFHRLYKGLAYYKLHKADVRNQGHN